MPKSRTYLDHNATTPVRPDAMAAALEALEHLGNPSSVHAEGRAARARVELARARVAALVGAGPGEVVFTSGGTEANATALRPGALRCPYGRPVGRLLVGATSHRSALDGHGFPADATTVLPVDGHGRLDLDHLRRALALSAEPALVSVEMANSETGILQPVAEVVEAARAAGAAVHVDAVQALGRVPVDVAGLGLDAVSVSGHKAGGPMGAGALVIAPGRAGPRAALVAGSQQGGLRGGSENVPSIAGFGAACLALTRVGEAAAARMRTLRDRAEDAVRRAAPDAVIFGADVGRLPNTVLFAVPGLTAEAALIGLDLAGVAVSSGSACSSGKVGRSHVLSAMGVPADLAAGALRVSVGWTTTDADLARFAEAFASVLRRLYDGRTPQAA